MRPYLPRRESGRGLQPNQAPWHQDRIVYTREADQSAIVTCWMPLVDCDGASGCLRILPGVHKMLETTGASTGTAGRRTTSSSPRTPLEAARRESCALSCPAASAASHLGLPLSVGGCGQWKKRRRFITAFESRVDPCLSTLSQPVTATSMYPELASKY